VTPASGSIQNSRHAKVAKLHAVSAQVHEHVFGLDVEVEDVVGVAVHDSANQLPCIVLHLRSCQRLAQQHHEEVSVAQLHGHVHVASGAAHCGLQQVVGAHNVGVRWQDLCQDACLLHQPQASLLRGVCHLDCHLAATQRPSECCPNADLAMCPGLECASQDDTATGRALAARDVVVDVDTEHGEGAAGAGGANVGWDTAVWDRWCGNRCHG